MNSVIVVSRNLARIYEEGGQAHYFSSHSSTEDKIVKFLREEHFFYWVFKLILLTLIFISSHCFSSSQSVHMREIVAVA